MPAMSRAEGFARESLPLHPAPFPRLASGSLSFALSLQLAPFPFNHFRTLSFSVSHLSPVPPIISALLRQKQRGIPSTWSDHDSSLSPVSCHLHAAPSALTPFPRSLTQKQGSTGYWPC